jgi:hypothetical protein
MKPRSSEMAQDVRVPATGIFKNCSQPGQPDVVECPGRQASLLIRRMGELDQAAALPGQPGRVEGDGVKGIAENASEHVTLPLPLLDTCSGIRGSSYGIDDEGPRIACPEPGMGRSGLKD